MSIAVRCPAAIGVEFTDDASNTVLMLRAAAGRAGELRGRNRPTIHTILFILYTMASQSLRYGATVALAGPFGQQRIWR